MYKTNRLGMPYFEVLGCCVTKSEQLLSVTDSASASRNLHDDDQVHRLLSLCGSDDFFPLVMILTSFKLISSKQNSQHPSKWHCQKPSRQVCYCHVTVKPKPLY